MKKHCMAAAFCLLATSVTAQEAEPKPDRWSFGFSGGIHSTFTKYSELDKDFFPDPSGCTGGVFGVFAEYRLGNQSRWSLRPEFMFLSRNTRIEDIEVYADEAESGKLEYERKTKFFDFRLPIVYRFGAMEKAWHPYVYMAPVFGFARKGDITLTAQFNEDGDSWTDQYQTDVTKANMSSFYMAGMVGAGVSGRVQIAGFPLNVGAEISYEYGFTDTYGKKEKDGEAFSPLLFNVYDIKGSRKFQGIEAKVLVSVPLSAFRKKKKAEPVAQPEPVAVPEPVVEKKEPVEEEKPCYSLEEIEMMMAKGQRVEGKTICAIDDVLLFDFGKANIKPESYTYLNKLAVTLIRTNAHIEVKGHTDNVGSEAFNMKLSKERSESVAKYLIGRGVDKNKLSTSHYGMSRPLVSNDTEEGRRMNRRVEFEIK